VINDTAQGIAGKF